MLGVMSFVRVVRRSAFRLGIGLLGLYPGAVRADTTTNFYQVPAALIAGRAGTLIRAEPLAPPAGAAVAYRILYRSRDVDGRPIAVSGVVAAPPAAKFRRPVVTWGHGTSGIAPGCAPSRFPGHDFGSIGGLGTLLADGDIVVATDYQGLGAGKVHPYLVGPSEAHAMIDAVRAARALPGLDAGRRFASWGFSEGGQAALFTRALARSYAPELRFEGAAAVSAPTELRRLLAHDIGSPAGEVVASSAAWSWSHAYDLPIGQVVRLQALPALEHLATLCSLDLPERLGLGLATFAYGRDGFLRRQAENRPDWARVIARNSVPAQPGTPVFLAQGGGDALVSPSTTRDFAHRLCRDGVALDYDPIPFASHGGAEASSVEAATRWLAGRLSGARAPTDCASLGGRPQPL
ncbi:lipase family protein [Ancylobacter mangrovi]|uniref:lipase family protein n=1 Tax=Ancylobacter mangrovi TaxID=2972472 RepID=UPI0021631EAC|nr:lipase family protein [Ancylobacter mangrovi]MCS0502847.1 lipase family protein [Ancylobacter mangrovi]